MMKMLAVALILSSMGLAESGLTKPTCVILSPVEPAKGIATWSREGRSQKHSLTYLAGEYPAGIPFRSSIKDKDVDKVKEKGGRVIILDPHYTHEDLEKARKVVRDSPKSSLNPSMSQIACVIACSEHLYREAQCL